MKTTSAGPALLVLGASLVMSAVAGASSVVYPQYALFYWLGASGIVSLIGGAIIWARQGLGVSGE